jgi:hypothetical protein
MDGGYSEVPGSPMRTTSFASVLQTVVTPVPMMQPMMEGAEFLRGAAHCHDALFDELVLCRIGECLCQRGDALGDLYQGCRSGQVEKARDRRAREGRLTAEMKIAWTEDAWQDYLHWQQSDEKIRAAINELIKDIKRNPFKGLGNPEPLKHALGGHRSLPPFMERAARSCLPVA